MSAFHWIDDDAGYEDWLSQNPNGFMANLDKQPHSRYFRIHRATHRLPDRSTPHSINPRTGTSYSKVTADHISDLLAWAETRIPGIEFSARNFCKTCTPDSDSIITTVPTSDQSEYVRRASKLLAAGYVPRPTGILNPQVTYSTSPQYYRDPKVRAWILQRANGHCELCQSEAPFFTQTGEPFLESHHLVYLAESGPDTPDNTVALCPNCHRKLHLSNDQIELRDVLIAIVRKKELTFAKRSHRSHPD